MTDLETRLRELHDNLPDGGEGCLDFMSLKHEGDCSVTYALRAAAALALEEAASIANDMKWDPDGSGDNVASAIRARAAELRGGKP